MRIVVATCLLLASTIGSHGYVVRPVTSSLIRTTASKCELYSLEPASLWEIATNTVLSAAVSESSAGPPEAAGISYSKASYYSVLALYLMSFPGLWSQIKRSTVAKVKRKTFVSPGENSGGKSQRQQAGEIMACKYLMVTVATLSL